MVSSIPVNYPRLAASEDIFKYDGQEVRLRVRTEFKNSRHDTIIGVLRAPQPSRKALVLASTYDALSVLPDMAPGVISASLAASWIVAGVAPA